MKMFGRQEKSPKKVLAVASGGGLLDTTSTITAGFLRLRLHLRFSQ